MIECIANNDDDPTAFDYATSYLLSMICLCRIHMETSFLNHPHDITKDVYSANRLEMQFKNWSRLLFRLEYIWMVYSHVCRV